MTFFPFAIRLLVVLAFLTAELTAQPTLPRDRAPQVPGSIRAFVDRLYSVDPRERAEAACQIGRRHRDAADAIPVLLSMLGDDVTVPAIECEMSPWLRRTRALSVDALKQMETSPAQEAAEALGDIGNAAVPGLLQGLGHSDWKVRKFAAIGLGEVDQIVELTKVIDALAARLADVHPEVRDRSAWALGEIEDPAAVGPLLNALKDGDSRVRARAAWALGEIEHPSAVEGLLAALSDSDIVVRERSVWALGEIESESVRKTAAWALGEIEDPGAIDALRAAVSDAHAEVRRAVTQALRELGDHRRHK